MTLVRGEHLEVWLVGPGVANGIGAITVSIDRSKMNLGESL